MPDLTRVLVLVHVLGAFALVGGYVATNVLTEFARRAEDTTSRDMALKFSSRFDQLVLQPGGTLASLTGLIVVPVLGYSFITPWILASIVLWLIIMALGIVYWRRFGQRVDKAVASGDETAVTRVLREPRSVVVSRLENVALLVIIILMVMRPGS